MPSELDPGQLAVATPSADGGDRHAEQLGDLGGRHEIRASEPARRRERLGRGSTPIERDRSSHARQSSRPRLRPWSSRRSVLRSARCCTRRARGLKLGLCHDGRPACDRSARERSAATSRAAAARSRSRASRSASCRPGSQPKRRFSSAARFRRARSSSRQASAGSGTPAVDGEDRPRADRERGDQPLGRVASLRRGGRELLAGGHRAGWPRASGC